VKIKNLINNIFIFSLLIFFITSSNAGEIFVSLKKNKVNVRYGPSFESDIKYVYKKINLPLKQIDKKENFRRIIDFKNNSGWIHISQLKKSNSVIATKDKVLFKKPTLYRFWNFLIYGTSIAIGVFLVYLYSAYVFINK